ncbi:MAG: chitobiase/beta-hexosaminidase C-terminal domain-containing protein [Verrucomicrobiales bacterium]|nr:chitobiase/beta-hexosaminidase C-terminal domain-containing protein [Verrucomicrobiales bacterium]
MSRLLQLVAHLGRKLLFRSVTKDYEIEVPAFYRDDEIQVAITLVNDAADPTADQPFEVVDTTGWDLRVAVGNGLSGTGRRLIAQTLAFSRDSEGVFTGKLSLRTDAAAEYLQFPDAWDAITNYAANSSVYFEGSTYQSSGSTAAGESPRTNPEKWTSYEILREQLYLEIVLVRPEGMETVAQAPVSLLERVMQQPPVSPDLIENIDALADAMAARLVPSSTVQWERNRDAHVADVPAAETFDQANPVGYLGRVWYPSTQKFYQAIREIKAMVDLASAVDITLFHLPGTIDGVVPVAHARIGALNNFNPATNGVYTVEPVGDDIKPEGATFNTVIAGGFGARSIEVTSGKLYFVEIAAGERVTDGLTEISASGTIAAQSTAIMVIGGYGAAVRSLIKPAGAVRATDAAMPEHLPLGTVFRVVGGATLAGKRYRLTSVVTEVGVSQQFWSEIAGGSGPILPTEVQFFSEALKAYSGPDYNPATAYAPGDILASGGRFYAAHTASTGNAPDNRLYFGELLEFNPTAFIVANVRVKPNGGLKVDAGGVSVDLDAIAPDTFEVSTEAAMLELDAKPGDYAIRTDLGRQPYTLKQRPASELANWVSLDAERKEAGPTLGTLSRSRVNGAAIVQLDAKHGLFTGDEVTIRNLSGTGYNLVRVVVTVFSESSINYPSPGDDEAVTADTGGEVVRLVPVVVRPVTLTTATPIPIVVGAVGSPGVGQRAAREDHSHPAPGLANETEAGFMSPAHFALLEGMAGDAGPEVGFDGQVEAILIDDGKIWVGGEFTRYGTAARSRLALLDARARLDPVFDPQAGFTQSIIRIAKTSDGDVVVGSANANNYRGLSGGQIWKLEPDGTPRSGWNCPIPLATQGPTALVGLTTAGDTIVAITPQSLRVLASNGSNVVNATCNASMYDVAGHDAHTFWLSSSAFGPMAADVLVNGLIEPRALKLLGADSTPECPCLAGALVPSFEAGAGDGANATIRRIVVARGYDYDFAIAGTPRTATEDNGVDHAWNNGNSLRFRGLYKIRQDGLADDTFNINLTLAEAGAAIPFAVDSLGRIYFGGPVSEINGHAVTPWRLYRITATGVFDREFDAFNDKVLAAALIDDDHIVVGGAFTAYGARPAGRLTIVNAAGSIAIPGTSVKRGNVVTLTELPDVNQQPNAQYDLVRIPPADSSQVVGLFIYDPFLGWMDICSVCRIRTNAMPSVVFDPPSGTEIGGGLDITLSVPGFSQATIRYTLDGALPTASSPVYSTPIHVGGPATIKAYASLPTGGQDGPLSVAQYSAVVLPKLNTPSFTPASGEPPITVTINPPDGHPDATIRYTLDGSKVTQTSTAYTGPISLALATTIRAVAFKGGFEPSDEIAAVYQQTTPIPGVFGSIRYNLNEDDAYLQVVGASTSPLTANITLEYAINDRPWTPALDNLGRPTYVATIKLRIGGGLVYGGIVNIAARAIMPDGRRGAPTFLQYRQK